MHNYTSCGSCSQWAFRGYSISKKNMRSPLHVAAKHGHLDIVPFLVESGANRDVGREDDGATALFLAAEQGWIQIVRFLVASGCNIEKGRTDVDKGRLIGIFYYKQKNPFCHCYWEGATPNVCGDCIYQGFLSYTGGNSKTARQAALS